ncbi:MAG: hypothetical protein ACKOVA_15045, partial [Novosphingobium sp.]
FDTLGDKAFDQDLGAAALACHVTSSFFACRADTPDATPEKQKFRPGCSLAAPGRLSLSGA